MNGTISFIDRPVDRAVLVDPSRIKTLATPMKERQQRADSIPEQLGLLWSESWQFHSDSVY
jgi:hypothetical protein